MTFLPIVERELRVRARKPGTYWARTTWVLLAILFIVPQMLSGLAWADASTRGRWMFNALLIAAFLLSSLACLSTSDTISSERREGTLGLLLLTRVRPLDILLGKLGSGSIRSVCGLVTVLPVLAIPILAGGVTGGEVVRNAIVLINTVGYSLAVGLWASTRAADSFRTACLALMTVFLPMLILVGIEEAARGSGGGTSGIGLFSPLTALLAAGDKRYRSEPENYWASLVLTLGATVVFILVTTLNVGRKLGMEAAQARAAATATIERFTQTLKRRQDPLAWLIQKQAGLRVLIWTATVVFWSYMVIFSFFPWFGISRWRYIFAWPFGVAVSALTDGLISRAASRFLVEAKANGELEMLLTTSLGAETIVNSHWQALRRLLRKPVVISTLAGVAWLGLILSSAPGLTTRDFSWKLEYAFGWGLSALSCLAGVAAVCWLSFCYAACGHRQLGIIGRTVGLTTGVPYLLRTVLFMGLQVVAFRGLVSAKSWVIISWLEAFASILFYLWMIGKARSGFMAALSGRGAYFRSRDSFISPICDGVAALRGLPHRTTP